MGVIIYTYFNELIVFGQLGLLDKAHIILKVNFPRQIAIVSSLSNALVNLMINMFFVFIIAALSGDDVSIQGIVYIIFLAILVFVFALGVSFFLSIITVRFRDFKNIIELGLFLLYWATPVFYVVDHSLTGKVADVVKANPLGIVINQFRAALDVYAQPDYKLMIVYFIACLLLCIAGWFYFQSHVKKIAEYF